MRRAASSAQFYRLAYWQVADEELNYRRFFDVDTPRRGARRGPAWCSTPPTRCCSTAARPRRTSTASASTTPTAWPTRAGYLERLSEATGGAWVVVEKILEGDEELPDDWRGRRHHRVRRPGGSALLQCDAGGGRRPRPAVRAADRRRPPARSTTWSTRPSAQIVDDVAVRRGDRLASCARDLPRDIACATTPSRAMRACARALLVAFDRYRAYVVPGRGVDPDAGRGGRSTRPPSGPGRRSTPSATTPWTSSSTWCSGVRSAAQARRRAAALRDELVVRFQQVCGAGHGQGRRGHRLLPLDPAWSALNEVGGAPRPPGASPPTSSTTGARRCVDRRGRRPMTTGTTHDTKRCEDVRARLMALAEFGDEWRDLVSARELHAAHRTSVDGPHREPRLADPGRHLDRPTAPSSSSAQAYLLKAVREAEAVDVVDRPATPTARTRPWPATPRPCYARPRGACAASTSWTSRTAPSRARDRAVAEADPADLPGRRRRLPGLRDRS